MQQLKILHATDRLDKGPCVPGSRLWEAACSAHHAPRALGGGERRTGVEPTPTLEEAASMGPVDPREFYKPNYLMTCQSMGAAHGVTLALM
jgi:hypothetical protein